MGSTDSELRSDATVPQCALLQHWSMRDWSGGVRIGDLQEFDRLTVTTRNSVYDIVVLSPLSGDVMIRGGRFFPTFTPAHVCGSSLGGGFLKLGTVHPGFCLEVAPVDAKVIVTTRVRTLAVSVADVPDQGNRTM